MFGIKRKRGEVPYMVVALIILLAFAVIAFIALAIINGRLGGAAEFLRRLFRFGS